MIINPTALKRAKFEWRFGHSEFNRIEQKFQVLTPSLLINYTTEEISKITFSLLFFFTKGFITVLSYTSRHDTQVSLGLF